MSTILPSHLDDVDRWHRLVELQQTGQKNRRVILLRVARFISACNRLCGTLGHDGLLDG